MGPQSLGCTIHAASHLKVCFLIFEDPPCHFRPLGKEGESATLGSYSSHFFVLKQAVATGTAQPISALSQ